MKIVFDDKSYIDCRKSDNPGKVIIIISAKDQENPLKKITNAVEITTAEFKKLISDVQIQ
jgi:nitrate reductase NapAB chaperone NapD